ncbi:MAG: DNA alkylation repair protein [Clostridiales bacterium]|nr:DNA alkylation repair protein [Clostridiales bacterium]
MEASIIRSLQGEGDERYAAFQRKLLPTLPPESIIGVRAPLLRRMAAKLDEEQLGPLPHQYYEQNLLHAYCIAREGDFIRCVKKVDAFLPYVDNWAVCDQLRPGVFRHEKRLLPYIRRWLDSGKTYTQRFAIVMLMQHFLGAEFRQEHLHWVCGVRSEDYYVNMAIAWYLATALCHRWEETLEIFRNGQLSKWIHNKAIQKARESRLLSAEKKEYLATLKV